MSLIHITEEPTAILLRMDRKAGELADLVAEMQLVLRRYANDARPLVPVPAVLDHLVGRDPAFVYVPHAHDPRFRPAGWRPDRRSS